MFLNGMNNTTCGSDNKIDSSFFSYADMITDYGQTRTLADILIGLDKVHHFSNSKDAIKAVEDYVKGQNHYSISSRAFYVIAETLSSISFRGGKLDESTITRLFDLPHFEKEWENAMYKYGFAKLIKLICYCNEFRRYKCPKDILDDLRLLRSWDYSRRQNYFTVQSWNYPMFFFRNCIMNMWDEIAPNDCIDESRLKKYMFENHENSVNAIGLEETIKRDFVPDGCHPDVLFPKKFGSAPVYVEKYIGSKRKYVKSCGEGKGPNAYPESFEADYAFVLLWDDDNYICLGDESFSDWYAEYYLPKNDWTLPFYDRHGKIVFEDDNARDSFVMGLINELGPYWGIVPESLRPQNHDAEKYVALWKRNTNKEDRL